MTINYYIRNREAIYVIIAGLIASYVVAAFVGEHEGMCYVIVGLYNPKVSLIYGVLLPRSLLEIDFIRNSLGACYAGRALAMESAMVVFGYIYIMMVTIGLVRERPLNLIYGRKQVFGAVIVVICGMLFRPAHLHFTSITTNFIVPFSFYLIREAFIISTGFYYLSYLIVAVSMWRRVP